MVAAHGLLAGLRGGDFHHFFVYLHRAGIVYRSEVFELDTLLGFYSSGIEGQVRARDGVTYDAMNFYTARG